MGRQCRRIAFRAAVLWSSVRSTIRLGTGVDSRGVLPRPPKAARQGDGTSMNRSSIALSNLRGVVILIVLAFHSVLAYLASLPIVPHAFDQPPYRWQAIPIVDSQRFFGFDLFCAWQDVSLMSLMFFLSGLFVPASLARKGAVTFLSDRFFRIGLPLVLVVAFLMPLTYYPTYLVGAVDPSIGTYWEHWLALPFWACGPQWFLWQLLALNVLAAGLHRLAPGWIGVLGRLAARLYRSAQVLRGAGCAVGAGLCAAGPDLFALAMGKPGAVFVPVQPAAALSGLFLRRLRDRRARLRSRAAGLRWCAGAALGPVARSLDCGLCAVGAADLADGGRPDQRRS